MVNSNCFQHIIKERIVFMYRPGVEADSGAAEREAVGPLAAAAGARLEQMSRVVETSEPFDMTARNTAKELHARPQVPNILYPNIATKLECGKPILVHTQ